MVRGNADIYWPLLVDTMDERYCCERSGCPSHFWIPESVYFFDEYLDTALIPKADILLPFKSLSCPNACYSISSDVSF